MPYTLEGGPIPGPSNSLVYSSSAFRSHTPPGTAWQESDTLNLWEHGTSLVIYFCILATGYNHFMQCDALTEGILTEQLLNDPPRRIAKANAFTSFSRGCANQAPNTQLEDGTSSQKRV